MPIGDPDSSRFEEALSKRADLLSADSGLPAIVLYRNAHVFTGRTEPWQTGAILVDGQRIVAVGDESDLPRRGLAVPAATVDLAGQYVLPGLVDSHQHLATPPNRAFATAQLERDLFGGITTVRVMADDLRSIAELSRASHNFEIAAPDLRFAALFAGPTFYEDPRAIVASRGYRPGAAPWMQAATPDSDLREAVAMARGTGASAVKIYADLECDLVDRIAAEAKRQGLQVWAHASVFPATPLEVARAGVQVMSHARLLAYQGQAAMPTTYHHRAPVDVNRFAGGVPASVRNVLEEMRHKGIVLDATLLLDHEDEASTTFDAAASITKLAHEIGVRVCAGTDAHAAPDDPFPSLYKELRLLVDHAGFTAADALVAATAGGAAALGLGGVAGTLEPGKLANFMITSLDPTIDIDALRSVTATVKRGRLFARRQFDPVAGAAARAEEQ